MRLDFLTTVRRAITLVELMIAVAIFGLLFMTVSSFFIHGSSQTEKMLDKADILRYTRRVLSKIEEDIKEAEALTFYEDTDAYTNLHFRRLKNISTGGYDYLIYTYYKKEYSTGEKQLPVSIVREVVSGEPLPEKLAEEEILARLDIKTREQLKVGLIPEHTFTLPDGQTVRKQTRFVPLDDTFDAGLIWDSRYSEQQKEKMLAHASYMGVWNGSLVGYQDLSRTVAIDIQLIVGDSNRVVNLLRSTVYIRKAIYARIDQ